MKSLLNAYITCGLKYDFLVAEKIVGQYAGYDGLSRNTLANVPKNKRLKCIKAFSNPPKPKLFDYFK